MAARSSFFDLQSIPDYIYGIVVLQNSHACVCFTNHDLNVSTVAD